MFDVFTYLERDMATNNTEEIEEVKGKKQETSNLEKHPPELPIKRPLKYTWTFWYFEFDEQKSWEECLKENTNFDTLEDFLSLYHQINSPSKLQQGCDYGMFKQGFKPSWEDTANKDCGKWLIQLKKRKKNSELDQLCLKMLQCIITEVFNEYSDDVCGALINVRPKGDKLGIWTIDATKEQSVREIERKLKLQLSPKTKIVFQVHRDTMDKEEVEKKEQGTSNLEEHLPESPIKNSLKCTWTFWHSKLDKQTSREEYQKKIASFDTIEDFRSLYHHVESPSKLQQGCDYGMFKQGIKPSWEDTANRDGGRWLIRLTKEQRRSELDHLWLKMLQCIIGEAFHDDVCGAVVKIGQSGDKLAIWITNATREQSIKEIERKLRLQVSPETKIIYQIHKNIMVKEELERKEQETSNLEEYRLELPIKDSLKYAWTFWNYEPEKKKTRKECQKKIGSFKTVEDFLSLYHHVESPSKLREGRDYSMFKKRISPSLADKANKDGGSWLLQLERKHRHTKLDQLWKKMLQCIISDGFNEHSKDICGAVVTLRPRGDKLSIWTTDATKEYSIMEIGRKLRERLGISPEIKIGYTGHRDILSAMAEGKNWKITYEV